MATIGTIAISVQARTKKFEKSMNRAIRRVKRFGKSFSKIGRLVGKVGGIFSLVAGGGVAFMIKKQLDLADSTNKAARILGLQTEELIAYRQAAELSGVDTKTLDSSLTALIKRLGEARAGTGPLITFFQKYDETLLKNIKTQRNASGALKVVANAIQNAKNEADAAAIANAAFSRQGVKMVEIFRDEGAGAIEAARKETQKLGIAFGNVDGSKVEAAKDAMTRMKNVIEGVFLSLAVGLAPIIKVVADRFTTMATEGEGAGERILPVLKSALKFTAKLADGVNFLIGIWNTFRTVVTKVLSFIANEIANFFKFVQKIQNFFTGSDAKSSIAQFLDSFVEEADRQAEESFRKAGNAIGGGITGEFQNTVKGVLKEADNLANKVETKSRKAAEKASKTIRETVEKDIGFGKQIDSDLVFAGGVSSVKKEQQVRVDQLEETNSILKNIQNKVGGGAVAA